MTNNTTIHELLKLQRQKLELTQEEAALRAGFSSRTVQRLEAGLMELGHVKFVCYCNVLGIDIAGLIRAAVNDR